MDYLMELWPPILLSAVFVFVASSVLHMVLPIHKGDYKKLAGEDALTSALRGQVAPGDYMFPWSGSMKEMSSPEMLAKYEQGPVGVMTILPNGPPAMGKSLVQWFLYSVLVSVFVGYVGTLGLSRGAEYLRVFQITGTAAILAYSVAYIPDSIWKGRCWASTAKFMFDGVVYGLVTAGTFGWLWPTA
jgi:hypothetical protein